MQLAEVGSDVSDACVPKSGLCRSLAETRGSRKNRRDRVLLCVVRPIEEPSNSGGVELLGRPLDLVFAFDRFHPFAAERVEVERSELVRG